MAPLVNSLTFYDNLVSIEWKDKSVDYLSLSVLRGCCPCAFCSGEHDVFGNKYIGEKVSLSKEAVVVSKYSPLFKCPCQVSRTILG